MLKVRVKLRVIIRLNVLSKEMVTLNVIVILKVRLKITFKVNVELLICTQKTIRYIGEIR